MNVNQKHKLMLYPMVRVISKNSIGSGTIVFAEKDKDNHSLFNYYILTNEHVVSKLITIEKRWSNLFKRKIEKDILGTPMIETFAYKWYSRVEGSTGWKGKIVAYDKEEDLALLKMTIPYEYKYVAKLYPLDKIKGLKCFMDIYTVGCGLGQKPLITSGFISAFGEEIENKEYLLVTAPQIFGNSGGASFLKNTGEFVGVPAASGVIFIGYSPTPITHMSYIIPVWRICKFLKDQYYHFIYDNKLTSEQCRKLRKQARTEDELKMLKRLKSE